MPTLPSIEEVRENLSIVLWNDPILSTPCEPFAEHEFGTQLWELGKAMLKAIETSGLGLSAPQVGLSKRLIVVKPHEGGAIIAVNPTVVASGDRTPHEEGCLSLPGIQGPVWTRPCKCVLSYQDPIDGSAKSVELEGYDAFCAQHEADHLDGIMFFQRMSKHYRKQVLAEWNKKKG